MKKGNIFACIWEYIEEYTPLPYGKHNHIKTYGVEDLEWPTMTVIVEMDSYHSPLNPIGGRI
ncbi:hypothetical protein GCM10007096_10180 [Pullulanibacillus pueri]|uniref:Uncharacterized protein n=1 Tax=Pullulanibacillus pueri TaxID=1437324 RepID=A0A8J2ZTP4_9BACL|nr:hypothetical protein GCM10007096_10180 [Pullulanibacillus pueri]